VLREAGQRRAEEGTLEVTTIHRRTAGEQHVDESRAAKNAEV
jgi:hypothetical protein